MLTHFFSGATFPAGDFFAAAPRGRSLTRCGPERRCLPPGWCFFCCGPARTGVVFFFFAVAPPGRSLTHCGLGRFPHGPGVFFFCCGPAEPGEPITKNVWCTTSGLKRPGGATAKKKTPGERQGKEKPRAGAQRCFSFPCLSPGPEHKKNTLCGVFFALAPPKGRGAQWGATKKNTLHTRGRQQKKSRNQ